MIGSLLPRSTDYNERIRLLLSWGATFFPGGECSREHFIYKARQTSNVELANLLESEFGGRRCEIIHLSSRPEPNGKTCVADEYLSTSNQYKVTLENRRKEVLVLSPDNLERRDRTPEDCGYYISSSRMDARFGKTSNLAGHFLWL